MTSTKGAHMSQLKLEQLHLPDNYYTTLVQVYENLQTKLGENIYSCILYGSAVRGGIVDKVSDLNLLIILNESTPDAHRVIAKSIHGKVSIHPFVIARKGMKKSLEAFAVKFNSIRRNYMVLLGRDPFEQYDVDEKILFFLTEQALRNLRYRAVYKFITFGDDPKMYLNFLIRVTPQVFTDISEAFRVRGIKIPHDFQDRISVFRAKVGDEAIILDDMLQLKSRSFRLSEHEIFEFHRMLFTLLDNTISWLNK